jgi:hypothetical protein
VVDRPALAGHEVTSASFTQGRRLPTLTMRANEIVVFTSGVWHGSPNPRDHASRQCLDTYDAGYQK